MTRYRVTLIIEVEDDPALEGRVLPVTKADLRREFRMANLDLWLEYHIKNVKVEGGE